MRKAFIITIICAVLSGCGGSANDGPKPEPEEPAKENLTPEFAKGADISWVTEMEAKGQTFATTDGRQMECTALMKELGFNAIRLRVWVDPAGGWNGREDVLEKAKRVQKLGLALMIDFHYSDSWADPGQQTVPKAWASYDEAGLTRAIGDHTRDILKYLKDNHIDVQWVQIGNEVDDGMLWEKGRLSKHPEAFCSFVNAGSAAARLVYPDAIVILHHSSGEKMGALTWFYDAVKNVDYDMIGLSLYPSYWSGGTFTDWRSPTDSFLSNVKTLIARYDKPVMLCEVGMPVSEPQTAKMMLSYLLMKTRAIGVKGVFYWEPEAESGYNGGYDKGAFKDGRPTAALDPFAD